MTRIGRLVNITMVYAYDLKQILDELDAKLQILEHVHVR